MRPRRRWFERMWLPPTWLSGIVGISALVAVVSLGGCLLLDGPERPLPTRGDGFLVAGYHAYWTGAAWEAYPWDVLDRLYFFEIEAGPDGTLADPHGWPAQWSPMVARALEHDVDVVPTVSMHGASSFRELFSSRARSERLVGEIVALLEATPGLGGIHLDFEAFEPVGPIARDGFTAFVASLRDRMRAMDRTWILSSFALALDEDDVYAEAALAELVDYLVVQGYDFHSSGGPEAGPVAPVTGWGRLNWRYTVDRFLALGVAPRQIVMAVPMYGYEWPTVSAAPGSPTRGEAIELVLAPAPDVVPERVRAAERAAVHGLRRDPVSGSPWYAFRDSGGWHQGWFEDAESLRAKYRFVRERGLGGVAVFPLGYGDAAVWKDLGAAFAAPRSR